MIDAVRCENIVKTFIMGKNETPVLRGVDLAVPKQDFMMLVGPSGCGKTTLISVIAGILHFNQGSCCVLDQDLAALSPQDLLSFRSKNLGFIFQQFNLIPTLTLAQNIAIPLLINGVLMEHALDEAEALLNSVGLKGRAMDYPGKLSGGQQQRVAIARALIHKPALVICDEPTSALDHDTGIKIMDLMRTINQEYKTTFVIVTHDSRIFSYADTIAHMDDGRIISCERIKKS
jgi:putative ABC transport system ATP-binding protein